LFHLNGGRGSCYDHLAADYSISLGLDDFLPGCGRGCGHNRLSFARGQEKRSHCNETQFSFHDNLSFCIIRFWGLELAHPTSKSPQPCAGGFKAMAILRKSGPVSASSRDLYGISSESDHEAFWRLVVVSF
jgi:hypothetical protein